MNPAVIHSEARAELDAAISFYESRAKGLGLDLQAPSFISKCQTAFRLPPSPTPAAALVIGPTGSLSKAASRIPLSEIRISAVRLDRAISLNLVQPFRRAWFKVHPPSAVVPRRTGGSRFWPYYQLSTPDYPLLQECASTASSR